MKKIAVDFDHTIACTVDFPYRVRVRLLNRIVWAYIRHMKRRGYVVILNTLRHDDSLRFAEDFCRHNRIPIDLVNENVPAEVAMWGHDSRKIAADLHLDDRNIGLIGWLLRRFA